MPLDFGIISIVSLLTLASVGGAQTPDSFKAGSHHAENSAPLWYLNRVSSNADTVVTTAGASKVTLGLRLLNKVDDDLLRQFKKAWAVSKAGFDSCEGLVVIFLMQDGRYVGHTPGSTNEFEQVSFKWDPATIAIVHTHPNLINPRPSRVDQLAAEKLGIPIFTITSRGMYVYNPTTMQTTRVMDDLDWLEGSKWAKWMAKHHTPVDEYSDLSY
jgi:hypothetical protein